MRIFNEAWFGYSIIPSKIFTQMTHTYTIFVKADEKNSSYLPDLSSWVKYGRTNGQRTDRRIGWIQHNPTPTPRRSPPPQTTSLLGYYYLTEVSVCLMKTTQHGQHKNEADPRITTESTNHVGCYQIDYCSLWRKVLEARVQSQAIINSFCWCVCFLNDFIADFWWFAK